MKEKIIIDNRTGQVTPKGFIEWENDIREKIYNGEDPPMPELKLRMSAESEIDRIRFGNLSHIYGCKVYNHC